MTRGHHPPPPQAPPPSFLLTSKAFLRLRLRLRDFLGDPRCVKLYQSSSLCFLSPIPSACCSTRLALEPYLQGSVARSLRLPPWLHQMVGTVMPTPLLQAVVAAAGQADRWEHKRALANGVCSA